LFLERGRTVAFELGWTVSHCDLRWRVNENHLSLTVSRGEFGEEDGQRRRYHLWNEVADSALRQESAELKE
jgi:hypothetical protein